MPTPLPLGWIPFPERTPEQLDEHAAALAAMPAQFSLKGAPATDPGPKVRLSKIWTAPQVTAAIGREFTGVRQVTGACVGAAFGNVALTLGAVEVLRLNDPEQIVLPFWPYTYGLGRTLLGMRGPGEGSTGSAMAEAAKRYGVMANATSGLPMPSEQNGLCWGQAVELQWSNGLATPPALVSVGKEHLFRTVAPCKSSAEVRTAIRNLYPVTMAIDKYVQPGSERIMGTNEPCVVGEPNVKGGHQTSILDVYDHPELGTIFRYVNQWGLTTYQHDPLTGTANGVWLLEKTMDAACKGNGEVYAYSQYDGYPAQTINYYF